MYFRMTSLDNYRTVEDSSFFPAELRYFIAVQRQVFRGSCYANQSASTVINANKYLVRQ